MLNTKAADAADFLSSRGYQFYRSRKFYTPKPGHNILPDEQIAIDIILEAYPNRYELVK